METEVGGTTLYYEIEGAGLPCFVLHGGLGLDHSSYQKTLGRLADSALQLIYVDQRNNGRSGRPPIAELTMERLADDVSELADALGIDRFVVFGHSYGGNVALELAARHPDRLVAMILVGTQAGQLGATEGADEHPPPLRPEGLRAIESQPFSTDDEAAAMWRSALAYFTDEESLPALMNAMEETVFDAAVCIRSDAIYQSWSAIDRLSTMQVPALVIVGTDDLICSPAESLRIVDRLAMCTYVPLAGANHFPWIEKPDEFFSTVEEWIAAI